MICGNGYSFFDGPDYGSEMNTTLSDRIKAIRQGLGLNQTEFGERLDATQSTVARWEKGSQPSANYLHKIADLANTTVDSLLGLDAMQALSASTIQVVGYVGAGAVVVPIDDYAKGDGMGFIERPPSVHGKAVAVEVQGDSLFPVAENGWRLVYTGDQTMDESEVLNRLCIVKLVNGQILVKRVVKGSVKQRYHLVSTNAPMIEDAEIEWAAIVKAIIPR